MDVSRIIHGSSDGGTDIAQSISSNKQGPIGITPPTPHDEEALNQRVDDGSSTKPTNEDVERATSANPDAHPRSAETANDSTNVIKSDDAPPNEPSNIDDNVSNHTSKQRSLSSSFDNVVLEHSLGVLDNVASTRPPKRQCLLNHSTEKQNPSHNQTFMEMNSAEGASVPQFGNDDPSVNIDNAPSNSFDVGGGSSPFVKKSRSNEISLNEKNMIVGEGQKRSISGAEARIKTAMMAANVIDEDVIETPRDEDEVETPRASHSPSRVQAPNTKKSAPNDELDFDKLPTMKPSDNNDNLDVKSDISSASSLVETYPDDEESRPFPPAPPSTPATAKDMYQPLQFQLDSTAGSLEYSIELKKGTEHSTPPNISATPRGPPLMPEHELGEDVVTPRPSNAATVETPQGGDETPDISGYATERRQGHDSKKGKIKLAKKTDFEVWDVGDRYELKRVLGRGSYGEVAQAVDRHAVALQERATQSQSHLPLHYRNSTYVAVKKISKAFDQEVDAVRLFREMHILRRLRGHECIIQLVDVVQPRSSDLNLFNDLYLVFEYVDTDLYKLIMSPQYLTTEHIQTFLYQMLVGLKYIHSSSVIHRDLKPAILLNEDCTLKICDFGLARIVHNDKVKATSVTTPKRDARGVLTAAPQTSSTVPQTPPTDMDRDQFRSVPRPGLSRQLTKHVVTRWYRAPELILIQNYASAVDIWSLGCIFAELLSMQEGSVPTYQDRQPLFPGGSCYPLSGDTGATGSDERADQLSVIFSVIGMPSEEDLKSVGKAHDYIKSLEKRPRRSLESLYPAADPAAIDLLKTMLMFNPAKRCTAVEALDHDFLKPVRRKDMEKLAKEPLVSPVFLDKNRIDVSTLKEETYKEVLWYKKSHERYQR